MFGFIRRWWRRRNRSYRCDDCGTVVRRSKHRATVRVEQITKPEGELEELGKNLDRVQALRIKGERVVLTCPACEEKRRAEWNERFTAAMKATAEEGAMVMDGARGTAKAEMFKKAFGGTA